jgi:membrane protein DedA with SNARE-associated domain
LKLAIFKALVISFGVSFVGLAAVHNSLIDKYGYFAVLLLVGLEATGIPVPGEITLVSAGVYSAETHHLNIFLVVIFASLGGILGVNLGYFIGKKGGFPLVRKIGKVIRLTDDRLKVARYMLEEHGAAILIAGRFISLLRSLLGLICGIVKMRFRKFFFLNAIAVIAWSSLYGFGSYYFDSVLNKLNKVVTYVAIPVVIIAIIAVIVIMKKNEAKFSERANERFPGTIDEWV